MRTYGRTDGRKDMTQLIVAFRNFDKAPKKTTVLSIGFAKSSVGVTFSIFTGRRLSRLCCYDASFFKQAVSRKA